ncbi:MAG: hypothetical protein RIS44_3253 [Pseudomonadota bacterium]|jgi:hypothetical protein
MASAQLIGRGQCPVCVHDRARFSLSKKGLVCVTCDRCNVQIFARSSESDQRLRNRIKEAAPEAAPAPEAVPETPTPPPAAPAPEPSGSFGLKWF